VDQAPPIYVRSAQVAIATPTARLIALGVALACLAILVVAVRVEPSPDGLGTHTQLGYARCGYLALSGIPCPTCGMTTSFAHFVRGRLAQSAYAQPMGTFLAICASMSVWAGAYIAISGRPAQRILNLVPLWYWLTPVMTLMIGAWAWKIFVVVSARASQ
jgi:ABC-type glucose/galactose transport system permease subunit